MSDRSISKQQETLKKLKNRVRRMRRLLREVYTRLDCDERDTAVCAQILKELKR